MLVEIMWCNLVVIMDIVVNFIRFVFVIEIYFVVFCIFLFFGFDVGFNELFEIKFFFV